MWLSKQQHVFHFVHDAMSSYHQVFAVPSMWMPIVRTGGFLFCLLLVYFRSGWAIKLCICEKKKPEAEEFL